MTDPALLAPHGPGDGVTVDLGAGRDAIHAWFSLTYANYLALPRSVLQSMPGEWQVRFVGMLHELTAKCREHGVELPATEVRKRGRNGRWVEDPLSRYDRGRRDVFAENGP